MKKITPEECKELARKALTMFLKDCQLQDPAQIGDVLMGFMSVAGGTLAQAVGGTEAAERIEAVAAYIRINMPATPAKLVPIQ